MSSSPAERPVKLKQARLPFARLPPGTSPPSKKPKLEEPPEPKNEESAVAATIVIEDDDAVEETPEETSEKILNPFVLLVDLALKRKLAKKCTNAETATPQDKSKAVTDEVQNESPARMDVDEPENTTASKEHSEEDSSLSDGESEEDDNVNDQSVDTTIVEPTTPKSSKGILSETDSPRTPRTPSDASKITPKLLQQKLKSAEKQKERDRQREEREKKKLEEKELRAKQRQEKDDQRRKEKEEKEEQRKKEKEEKEEQRKKEKEEKEEQRRKEKEEKEEQRKKEKEERDRIKEMKEEMKQQMKEQKRKEREMKEEEEKLRKEKEKEKEENMKRKAAAVFANFLVVKEKIPKKENVESVTSENSICNHKFLSNFSIKSDMRLAPTFRRQLTDIEKETLSNYLLKQNENKDSLYLGLIKSKEYKIKKCGKTWPLEELKNDIMIIEDGLPPVEENQTIEDVPHPKTMKPKMLSFSENRRPAYWGTWRKRTKKINGRRPFAMDTTHLDYTCDSDEEWEEEEPGESVESIAGSDDEEEENEYDVDNDFMVPHGYLSDEEVLGEDDNALSPEALKAKLKYLENEFEDEMKKPTTIKKPRVIGIVWQNSTGGRPDSCPETIWNFLTQKSIICADTEIIIHSSDISMELDQEENEKSNPKKSKKLSDDMVPALIQLVHGNVNNRGFLVKEFLTYISKSNETPVENNEGIQPHINREISKISIARKIKEISNWMPCPEEGPMYSKMCWFVEKEVREKYDLNDLQLPNKWSYTLVPRSKLAIKKDKQSKPSPESKNTPNDSPVSKKENVFNITKFTKKMSQEEREKQFVPNNNIAKDVNGENNQSDKKRVPLLFLGPKEKTPSNSPTVSDSSSKSTSAQKTSLKQDKADSGSKPEKKRVSFVTLNSPASPNVNKPVRTNLLTQFINTAPEKYSKICENELKQNDECLILSD